MKRFYEWGKNEEDILAQLLQMASKESHTIRISKNVYPFERYSPFLGLARKDWWNPGSNWHLFDKIYLHISFSSLMTPLDLVSAQFCGRNFKIRYLTKTSDVDLFVWFSNFHICIFTCLLPHEYVCEILNKKQRYSSQSFGNNWTIFPA